MAEHSAKSRITLQPQTRRVRILDGDTLIADPRNAIKPRERGYPHRPDHQKEFPREDADMSKYSVVSIVSCPPLNGDSSCCSVRDLADVFWSYERSIVEIQAVRDRLAFDADKVTKDGLLSTQSGHVGKGSMLVHPCYTTKSLL